MFMTYYLYCTTRFVLIFQGLVRSEVDQRNKTNKVSLTVSENNLGCWEQDF